MTMACQLLEPSEVMATGPMSGSVAYSVMLMHTIPWKADRVVGLDIDELTDMLNVAVLESVLAMTVKVPEPFPLFHVTVWLDHMNIHWLGVFFHASHTVRPMAMDKLTM